MFKIILKNLVLVTVVALTITSCKKDKKNIVEPAPEETTQSMSLNFTTIANNSNFDFANSYTTNTGARFKIESFRYYVSNIRLVRDNGSEYAIADKVLLINTTIPNYDLGQVPIDSYIGVRFIIGLDSATNHKDPTVYPTGHALAIQSPGIHWSWNSGYIFLMTEGSCDTTSNNSDVLNGLGQYNHPMFFHIGTDALDREVDLQRHFHVTADGPCQFKIKSDLNALLNNIDIKTQNMSHTFGSLPLATTIANNIPVMFTPAP